MTASLPAKGGDVIAPQDFHHDPWLMPAGEELAQVANYLFDKMERSFPRTGRVRQDAAQRRHDMVRNLVANLALVSAYKSQGSRLVVSARNDATTRYDREHFSRKAFMAVIAALERLGVIERYRGVKGGPRTALSPTNAMRGLVPPASSFPALRRLPSAETIILKASAGRNRSKVLIDYSDTPQTRFMRSQMDSINEALNKADITLAGQRQPPIHLSRIFQIDNATAPHTFNQHGRLYGGFWMNLPKAQRHLLRIDGQQVADLDFSAMHVRMAYIYAGLEPPPDDPYEGLEDMPRDAAKIALSALFSRSGVMKQAPKDFHLVAGRSWTGRQITEAAAQRHPGIAHLFGTGIGMSFMFTDSEILVQALLHLAAKGIVALPMHDGLMVAENLEEQCRKAMLSSSTKILGRPLPVVTKR